MKEFYDRGITDKMLLKRIEHLNQLEKAIAKAEIMIKEPWEFTKKSSLLVVVGFALSFLTEYILSPLCMLLKFIGVLNVPQIEFEIMNTPWFIIILIPSTTVALLLMIILGIGIHMPKLYVIDHTDINGLYFASATETIHINNKLYTVRKDANGGIHIMNKGIDPEAMKQFYFGIKAFFYQFRACKMFNLQKKEITKSQIVQKYFAEQEIEDILKKKRDKSNYGLLIFNRVLASFYFVSSLLGSIITPLLTIFVLQF